MTVDARIVVHRSGWSLDLELAVGAGEVVALLGPNGAGKTTALRVLAGLQPLDAGHVVIAGETVTDLPSARRSVGVVFQDHLLFPHLSALENVAFGPRARGVPAAVARRTAREWLDRVGVGEHAAARPRTLSGGQAQRVALARALAAEPRLLLLDEPLAALDARTRLTVRSDLRRHLASFGGAAVLVTHDPFDAMVLADRIVVVEDGAEVQTGTPAEVSRRPRTEYVARLVGLNLLRGVATGHHVDVDGGGELVTADSAFGPVYAAFRPAAVSVYPERPAGSPRNVWPGRVTTAEPHGDAVRIQVDAAGLPVLVDCTTAAVAELGLGPGSPVWLSVKASEIEVYPS
ncbi:MAG: molybdate transport system ATP-binding protein [Actinomycetota bacterium]|nr:molybdate transport system ATP-binding protein [Actinomycetota bacterium]